MCWSLTPNSREKKEMLYEWKQRFYFLTTFFLSVPFKM